ncbi:restriction endonuclease [Polyangium sp. 15x6]|uniref:restriction endonuclease n=1 Tax=Polyangium sp. 15x6 TaxID=3042687 RepID=UPI0032B617FF
MQKKLDPGAHVEWDVRVRARSGAIRQIDVVRGKLGTADVAVAIEAKDRNKPVTINMVGDFFVAFTGIGAKHGIMVSNLGFTEDALLEAKERGITTCILRLANDEDWGRYLRDFQLTIQSRTLLYQDAEIVMANGERHPVSQGGMEFMFDRRGNHVFFDEHVNSWLDDNPWEEGDLIEIAPGRPLRFRRNEQEDFVDVTELRFRPTYSDGMTMELQKRRPEDWVYVQQTPDGFRDERSFFVFAKLEKLADEFKAARAARKQTKKAGSKVTAKKTTAKKRTSKRTRKKSSP